MIEKGILFALVAPLLFKPRATVAAIDRREPPPLAEASEPSVATAATVAAIGGEDGIPWPELPQMKTADVAVSNLLAELVDYHGAGATVRFSFIASYYRQFAARNLWPVIADKSLSQMLCAHGCERHKPVTRDADGRRPTFIVLVPALAIDEEEFIEPMRLAA